MVKIGTTKYLLYYFILSLLFMDILFRSLVTGGIFSLGFIISALFLISFAIICFIISTLTHGKFSFIISCFLLGTASLLYSSQYIYHEFFKTFYSLYSAGNAGQVLDFWQDIVTVLERNAFWVILFLLPTLLFLLFGYKLLYFKTINWFPRVVLVAIIILVHISSLIVILASGKEQHSAHDLYFNSNYPSLSAEKIGLITMMRLDLQRSLTGWSPEIEAPSIVVPAYFSNPTRDISDRTANTKDEIEQEIDEEIIEFNTMDIDFEKLAANEENEEIKNMHNYFNSIEPTAKNDYTGKYKGYNLILITAESFSPFAVHEGATPTLYKLINDGYNFVNFYTPSWEVSTTDGEYVALTSLLPKSGVWSFEESADNYLPFVMGNQFKELDYKTLAYHNHSYTYYSRHLSHPNMGYEYKGLGNGLNIRETWPESDLEMVEKTVPEYINDEPFHAYYMTVSGHMQYSFSGNVMARKNQDLVMDLPFSDQAKAYISTQIELDKALEHLLNQLEEAGIAENTLIALSGDHYPYGLDDKTIDEFAGHSVEQNFELYENDFILYTEGMEPKTITKPSSSLDIIPTLSNLFGLEYDSRLLMGTDIFSDADPIVPFLNKSYVTDKGKYNAEDQKFIPDNGQEVDQEYIDWISTIVENKFYYSTKILEHDYYDIVLGEVQQSN
ncbi:sulfatase-like hydrolase/transferase [Aquibacillus halophilus]|uniref:Sulfatase-like hydrolase/transferase n=1 Tax=Aquibacillus halophilus TaxID=930132 RepID=A0A6A8DDW4_9BACI|nr:LTA synthase family protein [Aquibacillus halophilus]MRH43885.1 sulfatase-like hydrolase/transferase [Aquibacillus halophilus]